MRFALDAKGPPVKLEPPLSGTTPAWVEFHASGGDLPFLVRFRMEFRDGGYPIARYSVEELPGGAPIQSATLREVPVYDLAYRGLIEVGPEPQRGRMVGVAGELLRLDETGAELRRRGPHDPYVANLVGRVYEAARLRGEPRAEAVATLLGCSRATAAKFIAAAKDDGVLTARPVHKRGVGR